MTPREYQREFFETLGHAVAQWQNVEMELFRIYTWVMRAESSTVLSAAFHSIVNFNARLTMVDAAARVALANSDCLKTWMRLCKRTTKHVKDRNKLVHYMAYYAFDESNGHRPQLQQTFMKYVFSNEPEPEPIDLIRLRQIRSNFGVLSEDMYKFARELELAPRA